MLEPPLPGPVPSSPFRALAVRHGFDLEPALPDPAPAYIDPEGTFHPALTEPLRSLTLHRFPTPGARAALVSRLLSEPGHPDLDDPEDPFIALYRYGARAAMEPEVTGCMALLLLRERMAANRRTWRPELPDPVAALRDPDIDVFRHRRARLVDTPWEALWQEVSAAAQFVGDDPALRFEREIVLASAEWLGVYRAWWEVARHLGETEQVPDDPADLDRALGEFDVQLGPAIEQGVRAEAEFMELVGERPESYVDARWLLTAQVRVLRDLRSATQERSLELHHLLRRCDVARLRVQVAYRAELLRLWRADDPHEVEERLLQIPDPGHPTTLGAGLGRVLGVVLLRRLRRGEDADADVLASRALHLAPEELAVRLTWNDLRFHRGPRDSALLASVRHERDRWDSTSVRAMGTRLARESGDRATERYMGAGLAERALGAGTAGGWALAVQETLCSPSARLDRTRLDTLVEGQPEEPTDKDPLLFLALGDLPIDQGWSDLELALAVASDDLEQAQGLESHALPAARKSTAAWRQLVTKKLVDPQHPEFAGRLFSRLQGLRAAAPEVRCPPLAGQLRGLQRQLAEAADLGVPPPEQLAEVLGRIGGWLKDPGDGSAKSLAGWLEQVRDPLRIALRAPRTDALAAALDALRSRFRLAGRTAEQAEVQRLRADLADPGADLDALSDRLAGLALEPKTEESEPEEGAMRFHDDFDRFSLEELGMLPEALVRARKLVHLFNLSGGRRDRKRLKSAGGLFELRHRTTRHGGLRVFYRRSGSGWVALAAMSKFDDWQQQDAIDRIVTRFDPVQPC